MAPQTWKIIGPAKPPVLMKVEQALWNFLWDCATGTCHPITDLKSTLEGAAEASLDATTDDFAWFYPGIFHSLLGAFIHSLVS